MSTSELARLLLRIEADTGRLRRAIDFADEIAKTADRIGIATDALQELRFATDLAGVSQANLDSALEAFSKRLGETRAGTGVPREARRGVALAGDVGGQRLGGVRSDPARHGRAREPGRPHGLVGRHLRPHGGHQDGELGARRLR